MVYKTLLIVCLVAVAFVFVSGFFTDKAFAQEEDWTERKGLKGLMSAKREGTGDGPTKVQMGLGLGSLVVAFAVWKWL